MRWKFVGSEGNMVIRRNLDFSELSLCGIFSGLIPFGSGSVLSSVVIDPLQSTYSASMCPLPFTSVSESQKSTLCAPYCRWWNVCFSQLKLIDLSGSAVNLSMLCIHAEPFKVWPGVALSLSVFWSLWPAFLLWGCWSFICLSSLSLQLDLEYLLSLH